ncbi:glycosyltransferase [Oceanobacillus bengalensis]|uniref:Glycosyltransferase n=1 Tax=Oceanobacillus bengalensis TaxID=1435466 RepID=A0A494YSJ9_9BACI|nr:glycosyltransferase [Oceanobacillus bengalensis]RKQ12959.1 glycosyltransferase [Oceanobacillus bengalensis]
MQRLLYITPVNKNLVGIWKKIKMQVNYFEKKKISVDILDVKRDTNHRILNAILKRIPYVGIHRWSINFEDIKNTDYVYIRYEKSDYQFVKSLKTIKETNPKIKVLVEIPTYPYDNEGQISISNILIILKDRRNRRKMYKYVDRIITFSDDQFIFGIPTIRVSNAVNTQNITPKKIITSSMAINVIAVANFAFWHGYDRFIKGLYNYYNSDNRNKESIILHLVGIGNELEHYKSLVSKYKLEKKVIFYGKMEGRELDEIYDKCDIGLDALGRHRSKVYYNSTLKGKEYGAKGLPIISGVRTELDNHEDFKYYLRVPAEDSPIDMIKVIHFYNEIYNSIESKEEIINNIRNYTESNFDVNVVWEKVVNFLKNK